MWHFVNLLQFAFCQFGKENSRSLILNFGIFFIDRDKVDLKFLFSALIMIDDIKIQGCGSTNTI